MTQNILFFLSIEWKIASRWISSTIGKSGPGKCNFRITYTITYVIHSALSKVNNLHFFWLHHKHHRQIPKNLPESFCTYRLRFIRKTSKPWSIIEGAVCTTLGCNAMNHLALCRACFITSHKVPRRVIWFCHISAPLDKIIHALCIFVSILR